MVDGAGGLFTAAKIAMSAGRGKGGGGYGDARGGGGDGQGEPPPGGGDGGGGGHDQLHAETGTEDPGGYWEYPNFGGPAIWHPASFSNPGGGPPNESTFNPANGNPMPSGGGGGQGGGGGYRPAGGGWNQ